MGKRISKNRTWMKEENILKSERRYTKLFPFLTNNIKIGLVYLKNGEEVGLHSTKAGEEIIVILSGSGFLTVNEERISIKSGDVLYIGPYTEHNVKAREDGEIRYTYIYSKIKF